MNFISDFSFVDKKKLLFELREFRKGTPTVVNDISYLMEFLIEAQEHQGPSGVEKEFERMSNVYIKYIDEDSSDDCKILAKEVSVCAYIYTQSYKKFLGVSKNITLNEVLSIMDTINIRDVFIRVLMPYQDIVSIYNIEGYTERNLNNMMNNLGAEILCMGGTREEEKELMNIAYFTNHKFNTINSKLMLMSFMLITLNEDRETENLIAKNVLKQTLDLYSKNKNIKNSKVFNSILFFLEDINIYNEFYSKVKIPFHLKDIYKMKHTHEMKKLSRELNKFNS